MLMPPAAVSSAVSAHTGAGADWLTSSILLADAETIRNRDGCQTQTPPLHAHMRTFYSLPT